MKIIKKGELPSEKIHKAECRHCKTVFEFAQHEGKFHGSDPRDHVDCWSINCPLCNYQVFFYV